MKLFVTPSAQDELQEAAEYYKSVSSRLLSAALLSEFERVAGLLQQHPHIGTLEKSGSHPIRWIALRRFPFSVYYRVVAEEIQVLALGHHRRRPGYWKSRST